MQKHIETLQTDSDMYTQNRHKSVQGIGVASYGALRYVPLQLPLISFFQLISESHKVYNSQLCLVLRAFENMWNRQQEVFCHCHA